MGWTYNTVDPNAPTTAPTIIAVGGTFSALSLIVVCLRMYVRKFMINAVAIDDYAIVITWVSCWPLNTSQFLLTVPSSVLLDFWLSRHCVRFRSVVVTYFRLSIFRDKMGPWSEESRRYAEWKLFQFWVGKYWSRAQSFMFFAYIKSFNFAVLLCMQYK